MKIDLHNHTNHSDGVYTPQELLDRAIYKKVDIFALTDHDSVFGCEEIARLSEGRKILVIKGMELSTYYKGESVHIVCLFEKNKIPQEMIDFSYKTLEQRKERAIRMMHNIEQIYHLKMDIAELLAENEVITRANMLRNIAKHNAMSYVEASFYVSKDSKAYIPSSKLSVADGIAFARRAGCIPIFAHPCLVRQDFVEEILRFGFDGIEVRYPSPKNDEKALRELAEKYHLFISAGSDCHGDSTHADIGTATLNEAEFLPLLKRLKLEEEVKRIWK